MLNYFLIAAVMVVIVGLTHSIMGEILIFRHLRKGRIVPTVATLPLRERHVRILWASWHIVTVFGFGFGAALLWLSQSALQVGFENLVKDIIIYSMLASSILVLWATNGKHPGWIGLGTVALLTWLG